MKLQWIHWLGSLIWLGCLLALGLNTTTAREQDEQGTLARRPTNVVFILTDNQGAWTLGCYGNPDIRTPHIDRLASEGMRFTRALSSNPVCSPTRATFLTGLIPSQHGVHSFLDPKFMMGPAAYNTLEEFTSLGEILRDQGYVCGLSGKWHLGANMTPSEGFSTWTTKPDGSTREFYDQQIIENGQLRTEAGYTTDLWTRKGIEFIRAHRERPFFLMLAYNGPYVLGKLMQNRPLNRHAELYRDHAFTSFPRDTMHPWQFHNKDFHNTQIAMERTAAETSGVDDGVGEVLRVLDELELDSSTLVVYAADQGWMGGQNGLWGMGDHTRPIGAHELMMQIPFIFRQPGRISAGQTSDRLVSNYDFLPSVLGYLGLSDKLPQTPSLPGRDFSPLLLSAPTQGPATQAAATQGPATQAAAKESPATQAAAELGGDAVFYEMESCRAVRGERWKLVMRHPDGPHELYDMHHDPQERVNLYGQPGLEDERDQMQQQLEDFFNRYADPQYDLWKTGYSKAKRLGK